MDIRSIDNHLSVSPQISPEDVSALKEQGFTSIICNRPDGEEAGQPTFAQIQAAATSKRMKVLAIPVGPSGASDADVTAFADALANAAGPTLAYCRTGTRAAILWGLSQAGHMPADEIIAAAKKAGYDLNPLADRLNG